MTLHERITKLQQLLHGDGIEATLQECEDLLVADFIEQIRANPPTKVLDTVSV